MMVQVLFLFFFGQVSRIEKGETFMLHESVEILVGEFSDETFTRTLWLGKDHLRIDMDDGSESLIYSFDAPSIVRLLDHKNQQYSQAVGSKEKLVTRKPLAVLGSTAEGFIRKVRPLTTATGVKRKISGWTCHEFQLNYPRDYPVNTRMWSTKGQIDLDDFKKVLFAATGIYPPWDVRGMIESLLREIDGIPIQTVSTITQQGLTVTVTSTITHIERLSSSDSKIFETPSHYQLVQQAPNLP